MDGYRKRILELIPDQPSPLMQMIESGEARPMRSDEIPNEIHSWLKDRIEEDMTPF